MLPLNEMWLNDLGYKTVPGFGVVLTPLLSLFNSKNGWGLYFHGGLGDSNMNRLADVKNRNQFLVLTIGLGV